MTAPNWTVGIVGCGRIAGATDHPQQDGPVATHAQAYFRHPRFELAAAVCPTPEHLHAFQRTWNVPRGYRTVAEMLESECLDVISLCTPNRWHAAHAAEILTSSNRPKVLFVEKPVCCSHEELEHLTGLVQQAGVGVLVNHSRRFDPGHRRVAHLIRSGTLGSLVEGRCTYYGGWLNNGTHLVDTLLMLFPEELHVVSAVATGCGRGDDHNLDVTLRVGPALLQIGGFDESYYQLYEAEFRFEAGRVQLLDMGSRIVVERLEANRLKERILVPLEGSPLEGLRSPLAPAIDSIDACLRGEDTFAQLGVDLSSATVTMAVLWAAQGMAATGARSETVSEHAADR